MWRANLSKKAAIVVFSLTMSCAMAAGTAAIAAAPVTVSAASKTTKSKVVTRKVGSYKGTTGKTSKNSNS